MYYIKRKSDGRYVFLLDGGEVEASCIHTWGWINPSVIQGFSTKLEAERRVAWWKMCRYLKYDVEIVWEGDYEETGEEV